MRGGRTGGGSTGRSSSPEFLLSSEGGMGDGSLTIVFLNGNTGGGNGEVAGAGEVAGE